MATVEELMQKLRNAHNAGDTAAAKRFAQMIRAQQQQAPTPQPQIAEEDRGFMDVVTGRDLMTEQMESLQEIGGAPELNEMSLGALKASFGLLSTGDDSELRGILTKQFGDQVSFSEDEKGNTIVNLPSGQYAMNKPGLSGQDVIRTLFDVSAFLPASKAASIPAAFAKMAGTEAVIEAGEAAVGGEFDPEQVALSGAMGAGFKGLEDVVGTAYRAIKGAPDSAVVQAGKEAGVPVMTSDIRPPKTFWGKGATRLGERVPVAGTAGVRSQQQEARVAAVEALKDKYATFSYADVVKGLKDQKNKILKAAGNVLNKSGTKLDEVGEIPLANTQKAMYDSVKELTKKGVIKNQSAMDDIDTLVRAMSESPQTFTSLKENRTIFREMLDRVDPAGKSQLGTRAKTLVGRIEQAMKADMDDFAKANLSPKEYSSWKRANEVYFKEASKLTKSRIKNVLDKGDMTPEAAQTLLFSQKPSEVALLYKGLTNEGRQNARAAFINRVFEATGKRQGGSTPNSVLNELKKYPAQIDILFKGKDKKQLEGLITLLNNTTRAQDVAVMNANGQELVTLLTGAGLISAPKAGTAAVGTVGGLSRLYESAPVRDALLRVASIPKGSTGFEKAVADAVSIISVAAQASREESPQVPATRQVPVE